VRRITHEPGGESRARNNFRSAEAGDSRARFQCLRISGINIREQLAFANKVFGRSGGGWMEISPLAILVPRGADVKMYRI
jgi:hypothetical protein